MNLDDDSNRNPNQPSNGEVADMFRVLMHEAIQMHPHYLRLKYKFEGLQRHLENNPGGKKTKPDMEMIRFYVREMAAVFEEFK